MNNNYVPFIDDEKFLKAVSNLHKSYVNARREFTKKRFYANKIDIFKLVFDSKFNEIDEEDLINTEVLRQIDKSINNAIGSFHEEILGSIEGFEKGNLSGYDIKATDNSLFADIKNKHNTMNSSSAESLFQKLKKCADENKKSTCFWVQILATGSFDEPWFATINGKEYSHTRVRKISGDRFYALLSGQNDALFRIYEALPRAIDDYLKSENLTKSARTGSMLSEITDSKNGENRSIIHQIALDNFPFYAGFENL